VVSPLVVSPLVVSPLVVSPLVVTSVTEVCSRTPMKVPGSAAVR